MAALLILQRQPLREQEWLLDVFSESHGRLRLAASGRETPQLLTLYSGHWAQDQDWPRVRLLEMQEPLAASGTGLYCGLYLTELLCRLQPQGEVAPALFAALCDTLRGIASGGLPDPWLRLFEIHLLKTLGYGVNWQQDYRGQALDPALHYRFVAREGLMPAAQGISGQDLLAFASGQPDPAAFAAAKQVLRVAIDNLLEKPLVSRELFQGLPDPQ